MAHSYEQESEELDRAIVAVPITGTVTCSFPGKYTAYYLAVAVPPDWLAAFPGSYSSLC